MLDYGLEDLTRDIHGDEAYLSVMALPEFASLNPMNPRLVGKSL